jgi:hypothetical protein
MMVGTGGPDPGITSARQAGHDPRVRLVRLTDLGEQTAVRASRLHGADIEQYFPEPRPRLTGSGSRRTCAR